jgi:HD superfamily phosphohydrolase
VERILQSFVIVNNNDEWDVIPTIKALSAIEGLLLQRYFCYKWIYYHPHVVFTDKILAELIRFLVTIDSHRYFTVKYPRIRKDYSFMQTPDTTLPTC